MSVYESRWEKVTPDLGGFVKIFDGVHDTGVFLCPDGVSQLIRCINLATTDNGREELNSLSRDDTRELWERYVAVLAINSIGKGDIKKAKKILKDLSKAEKESFKH